MFCFTSRAPLQIAPTSLDRAMNRSRSSRFRWAPYRCHGGEDSRASNFSFCHVKKALQATQPCKAKTPAESQHGLDRRWFLRGGARVPARVGSFPCLSRLTQHAPKRGFLMTQNRVGHCTLFPDSALRRSVGIHLWCATTCRAKHASKRA